MNEFLIAIHRDLTSKHPSPSPEQMKEAMKPYKDWIAGIAAQDKLVAQPKRWDLDGRSSGNCKRMPDHQVRSYCRSTYGYSRCVIDNKLY